MAVPMAFYRITAVVRAPASTIVGNDALFSGIMGAFEPSTGFEAHAVEVDKINDADAPDPLIDGDL